MCEIAHNDRRLTINLVNNPVPVSTSRTCALAQLILIHSTIRAIHELASIRQQVAEIVIVRYSGLTASRSTVRIAGDELPTSVRLPAKHFNRMVAHGARPAMLVLNCS